MQTNVILDWTLENNVIRCLHHNAETQKIYLYHVVTVSQSGSSVQIKFLSHATQRDDFQMHHSAISPIDTKQMYAEMCQKLASSLLP